MARPKENTSRVNVFFMPEILEKLKFEAKKNGLSVSGYIRMIVIQRLNEESAN